MDAASRSRPDQLHSSEVTVAAVDVGSLANIGWWSTSDAGSRHGRDLDGLVAEVAGVLNAGGSVALGFEAPLYVPLPIESSGLNRQRVGEKGRPWCAGAGTGALAMGVQQAAWVFQSLAQQLNMTPMVSFEPAHLAQPGHLVVWEAFVSAGAKDRTATDPHVDDARVAVAEFRRRLADGVVATDIENHAVMSLAGASVLAAGLSLDVELLRRPCVVVRAPDLVSES